MGDRRDEGRWQRAGSRTDRPAADPSTERTMPDDTMFQAVQHEAAAQGGRSEPLPPSIASYVWRHSGKHQVGLSVLSAMVFLLSVWPLEIQRRIVNDAISSGSLSAIVGLSVVYLGIAILEGALKFILNLYRGWVSETAVRHLRMTILRLCGHASQSSVSHEQGGVAIALVLSEADPVGSFVGISLSEPLLQSGILVSVLGYMAYLRPEFALASTLLFLPQMIFVPLIQRAINHRAATRIRTLRRITSGMASVGASGSVSRADRAQSARVDAVFTLNMSIYTLKFGMNFLMNLMNHLGVAAVLGIGGWYVVQGIIDAGAVVAFVSGLAKIVDPWGDLINWYREATVSGVKYRLIETAVRQIAVGADLTGWSFQQERHPSSEKASPNLPNNDG
ncbi:ABC transporter ATP-binding protein (plasmid) [Azospirillum brasilense]|uniref:ABC transporter ATP-binding protein n=2 Tax=Azospirillum brasilense TaxID=192 RepID=A0A4D8QTZ0_AZOBR|nr:ABC transporter ATP-binding protein [Azospirillum brasilense]QEL93668.1 ABC transporter ATP-binding protein [Azospirillum brasilense]QEL99990.1 ABC transporter ATP-binding protein [Azospirillum brasilense]